MRLTHMTVLAGLVAALAARSASADVIMTNLEFADDDGGTIFGPNSFTEYKAYGWTMPDEAYFLDEVVLRLAAYDTGEARVSIWTGAELPESELIVLDIPTGPGEPGYHNITFTPLETFVLEANTTYWIYVEALDGGGDGFLWGDTTPPTLPTGIGTSVGFIFNGNPSSFMNALEIHGTLVPAPGALVLLALGAMTRRRRRN